MEKREKVVSGIRSTGFLHLGNYFGAIRNYVRMQEHYDCYFFVADYHSLTTHQEPGTLKDHVYRVLAENIACGLDPDKVALYVQSDLAETSELYLLLNMIAYKGELEKVPTFKDKVRGQPQNINAGLLTYPVLMSADILIQRAVKVPVGKDQEQHLELVRNLASRFNRKYGNLFPEPLAYNFGGQLLKIASLDGSGKMSKSENESATIYLGDSDEQIRKKISRAKTDPGPPYSNSPVPELVANLFLLMELVSDPPTLDLFRKSWDDCSIRYGDLKQQLSEDLVAFIAPIRDRAQALQADTLYLQRVMREGAEKARINASQTLKMARELMGIAYH